MAGSRLADRVRSFGFRDHPQTRNEMVLLGLTAIATLHVWSALTLTSDDVTVVIKRTSGVALALRAAIAAFRQAVGLGHALITVATHHQTFACAFAAVEVAAEVVDGSESVTQTSLASIRVRLGQIPKSFLADVASSSLDVSLTVTGTGDDFAFSVRHGIANSIVEGSDRVAVTGLAGVRTLDVLIWVAVEERHALLAVLSLRVVLAVVADTTADSS